VSLKFLIKRATTTLPLSTVPTLAPISPPPAQNHLPVEAPPTASVERRRVPISTTPPLSGVIGENPNDLPPLFPSYYDDLPSSGAVVPPHGRESIMNRELVVVPCSIDPILDFSYTKQLWEILKNAKIVGKLLYF
jgi:hypothetical protein